LFVFFSFVCAQNPRKLSLSECLEIALKNNLELKIHKINMEIAAAQTFQSKANYLPNLNAGFNYGRQFGTVFAAAGAIRIDQTVDFSGFNFASNVNLFNGFANYYVYKRNLSQLAAQNEGAERIANNLVAGLMLRFLTLVGDEANMDVTSKRIQTLKLQKERLTRLTEAGAIDGSELAAIEAQIAEEESNLILQQNRFAQNKLALLQLMNLDDENVDFVVPEITDEMVSNYVFPELSVVEAYALENMPEIREQRFNLVASQWNVKAARAAFYPVVSLNFNLSSNYSSFRSPFQNEVPSYFTQIKNNFQQFVGVGLNVPIFNALQARTNFKIQKLREDLSRATLNNAVNALRSNVRSVYLDAKQALASYAAAQKQAQAAAQAYRLSEARYDAGVQNFYQYLDALNARTNAETRLLFARYDLFFKLKLLDVYQGKEISF
ncbi:MAG: TolC family protein, partial [Bacteroidia bacterium]|nr:TolC family protein [Bacteroidia bacterium]MDW8332651.1 TolC family protein [Bacteroidia bacterium]